MKVSQSMRKVSRMRTGLTTFFQSAVAIALHHYAHLNSVLSPVIGYSPAVTVWRLVGSRSELQHGFIATTHTVYRLL
jgi:hypothetical protein